jgi:tetratricopeptide (TPR) repeat protein
MRNQTLIIAAALVAATAGGAYGQSLDEARKAYDTGQYPRAAEIAGASQDPRALYLGAQAQQKQRRADEAQRMYQQLAGRPDAWGAIGRSGIALLSSNAAGAVQEANQAVAQGGSIAEAHFQRGLALSTQGAMGDAAAAFQRAAELDPSWAYAHYYAGIAFSKAKRADLTAAHFQNFLKLAPQAPERGEVQSILRTLGR